MSEPPAVDSLLEGSEEEYAALLELQAACGGTDFDIDIDEVVSDAESLDAGEENSHDEGDAEVVTVGNDIVASTRLEIETFQKDKTLLSENAANEFACPFCPFSAWPRNLDNESIPTLKGTM